MVNVAGVHLRDCALFITTDTERRLEKGAGVEKRRNITEIDALTTKYVWSSWQLSTEPDAAAHLLSMCARRDEVRQSFKGG